MSTHHYYCKCGKGSEAISDNFQTIKRSRIWFLGFGFQGLVFLGGVLEAVWKKNECGFKKPQHWYKTACRFENL